MFKIDLSEAAELDIDEIVAHYEQQKTGLGYDFLVAFEEAMQIIEENPHLFAPYIDNFRRIIIKNFPYLALYYSVEHEKVINIVGIFHEKRSTKFIKRRL